MVMQVAAPEFVEIINVSKQVCTISDQGLWERGGMLTLAPGDKTTIPLAVYHRICAHPYIMWVKLYEEKKAADKAKAVEEAKVQAKKAKVQAKKAKAHAARAKRKTGKSKTAKPKATAPPPQTDNKESGPDDHE